MRIAIIIVMKKLFIILTIAVASMLCLASCSKDDSIDKKDLYGCWSCDYFISGGEKIQTNSQMEIDEDYLTHYYPGPDNKAYRDIYTWELKGKTLSLTPYEETPKSSLQSGTPSLKEAIKVLSGPEFKIKKLTSKELVMLLGGESEYHYTKVESLLF